MQTNESQRYDAIFDSPVGRLGIRLDAQGRVCGIENLFDEAAQATGSASAEPVIARLRTYFTNPGDSGRDEVPLAPVGTEYQQRVWRALRSIPSGEVLTYADLARELGSAPRPVGQACRRNPIPIFIPCHRVVSSGGVGGYAGATAGRWLAVKQWLLEHESAPRP